MNINIRTNLYNAGKSAGEPRFLWLQEFRFSRRYKSRFHSTSKNKQQFKETVSSQIDQKAFNIDILKSINTSNEFLLFEDIFQVLLCLVYRIGFRIIRYEPKKSSKDSLVLDYFLIKKKKITAFFYRERFSSQALNINLIKSTNLTHFERFVTWSQIIMSGIRESTVFTTRSTICSWILSTLIPRFCKS